MDEMQREDIMALVTNRQGWSRRDFVASVAAGFALAAQPVCAQTMIVTDTRGLIAGMVDVPARDGEIPAYRAMPAKGSNFPVI
ncbi:MAG TPA: carboxymethylenebutenolidase, partial [Burkholderiales bacterium]|nr:carboxymethylenebutenolidase [Burkholderiales bacterium]